MTTTTAARQTIRKYAHELYPHPPEDGVRPLSVEVPYLYARMVGLSVWGTGWGGADWRNDQWAREATVSRTVLLVEARHKALLADALLQGMAGDEAWTWAEQRAADESGEIPNDRAAHYGIPFDRIKPYPCGPEPDHHSHYGEPDARGWCIGTTIKVPESECPDCTEPVEAEPS